MVADKAVDMEMDKVADKMADMVDPYLNQS